MAGTIRLDNQKLVACVIRVRKLYRLEPVNLSLSQGVFSDKFKSAIITPILKKQSHDQSVFENYRPVSRLNFASNIIERVISLQKVRHLSANGLNNVHQSAYKTAHSTETALLRLKATCI